jgi:hypothetical protein
MNQLNQNSSQIDLDTRYRSLLIIWFAILSSVGFFFVITRFIPVPIRDANSVLVWIFLALGLSSFALSFVLKRQFFARSITEQKTALVQTGFVIALALSEVPGLLGLTLYFVTGINYYYLFFMISALALLLHLPRRDDLSAATAKSKF